jgi:translation initiation factor 2 subunit 3
MPKRIPKQPEINIGTAGHVDHGKCLTFDEFLFFSGRPYRGRELAKLAVEEGALIHSSEDEWLYRLPGYTYSLASSLTVSYPYIFLQRYKGTIFEIRTEAGRRVRVTPDHPLLLLTQKGPVWKRASNLKKGEPVAVYEGDGKVEEDEVLELDSEDLLASCYYLLMLKGCRLKLEYGKRYRLKVTGRGQATLSFDPISRIEKAPYSGYLIDLAVPILHNFLAGLGGFIAHNTTMVEALTGKWTSAHSEELRRGITIKVGYADAPIYECKGCPRPQAFNTEGICKHCGGEAELRRVVSFVDCPGHESLMANTLSGAALMDGAVFVIAVNEPVPQPQTREHLQALQMIGVKNIVVVQNKIDLVSYAQALENYDRIRSFLASYGYEDAPVIPISAQKLLNMDALLEAVEEYIPTPPRDETAPPLMQVLRSFDINKPGTPIDRFMGGVLGGSLKQGTLQVGDEIEIKPGIYLREKNTYLPIVTEVVSLGTSAGLVEKVKPGGLIAVGTKLDPYYTKSDVMVGNYISKPGILPDPVLEITMKTQLLDTAVGTAKMVKVEKIRLGEMLRLNVGTAVTAGAVTSVKGDIVTVKLRRAVCVLKDSRIAISRRIEERWRLIGVGTPA